MSTSVAANRRAYVEEKAKNWRPLQRGVSVILPVIGGAFVGWSHAGSSGLNSLGEAFDLDLGRPGSVEVRVGRCTLQADMPDHWFKGTTDAQRRLPAAIWYVAGLPILTLLVGLKAVVRALTDPFGWRLKRLGLHLAWRLRPAKMDAKVAEWREAIEAGKAAIRLLEERWANEQAEREAALEAEVERRLALRLAGASA